MENEIIKKLIDRNETISTMESCTGGAIVNRLTNVDGSSKVIKVSLVTYSNEYKIKFGVSKETIDNYSVYSNEVSRQMAKNASIFSGSTYSIGITGKINRVDIDNLYGNDNEIFYTIYDSKNDKYYDYKIVVPLEKRNICKNIIVDEVFEELNRIIN